MSLMNDNDKGQSIKSDEINGLQHFFHSYPKELQGWHNTQFMLEKKAPVDESSIPDSLLNGYMWQIIGDGTSFAILSSISLVIAILNLKFNPSFVGLFLSLLIIAPWTIYTMYHVIFYAKIRGQVVGPVTKKGYEHTSLVFYQTYGSVFFSMAIMFLYFMWILEDIINFIHPYVVNSSPDSAIGELLLVIYNFLVEVVTPPESLFWLVLSNTLVSTLLFFFITSLAVVWFEIKNFDIRVESVNKELAIEANISGYPIDNAIRKITAWRKTH